MRITGGDKKGIIYKLPKYFNARPTTDIAKESLFNILNNYIYFDEVSVLDLFAGSGSISYEFASRGCNRILAIEINKKYVEFIRETSARIFKQENIIKVQKADAFKFCKSAVINYDLIFADPPYDIEDIHTLPGIIFSNPSILPDCRLIIEHSAAIDVSKLTNYVNTRRYGKVNFSFFSKNSF